MQESELQEVSGYLPDIVHQMIDVIGFKAVEKVIRNFGGATFCFTDGIHYFPKLMELIGRENALKLRRYFNAEQVYIPRCEVALRILRNQRLKSEFDYLTQEKKKSGRMAMLEICPKYQLSDRQAWEIIHSFSRTQHTQTPLF